MRAFRLKRDAMVNFMTDIFLEYHFVIWNVLFESLFE